MVNEKSEKTDFRGSKDRPFKEAAVMVLLIRIGEEYSVVLTKRAAALKHHSGEISFPGGVREFNDTDCTRTAIRELHEELGIDPEQIEILGIMDCVLTSSSGFIITPIIGLLRDHPVHFSPNEAEIQRIFTIPLSHLAEQVNEKVWQTNESVSSPIFHYQNDVIWGATARILHMLLLKYRTLV